MHIILVINTLYKRMGLSKARKYFGVIIVDLTAIDI